MDKETSYRPFIQFGCVLAVLVIVGGSYFSWQKLRRIDVFELPQGAEAYRIEPGEKLGDVMVEFTVHFTDPDGLDVLQAVLDLNPGDGQIEAGKDYLRRVDSDKVVRVQNIGYGYKLWIRHIDPAKP